MLVSAVWLCWVSVGVTVLVGGPRPSRAMRTGKQKTKKKCVCMTHR